MSLRVQLSHVNGGSVFSQWPICKKTDRSIIQSAT